MRSVLLFCLCLLQATCSTAFVVRPSSLSPGQISTPLFSTTSQEEQTKTAADTLIQGNVILFDGVCNFCNAWVDILLRLDINEKFKFAPLQSDIGKELLVAIGKEADDISSVVLVKEDLKYYDKSSCVLQVVEELGPLAGVFSKAAEAVVPLQIRDSIYETVAENRYNFLGKRDECRCGDPKYAERFVS